MPFGLCAKTFACWRSIFRTLRSERANTLPTPLCNLHSQPGTICCSCTILSKSLEVTRERIEIKRLFSHREKYYNASRSIRTFREDTDWIQELERCGISYQNGAWRVLSQEHPMCENGLPQHFVVPKSLTNFEYFKLCESFRCKRAAIWVWSLGGASLVRMADLLPDLLKETHTHPNESLMFENIRKCSLQKTAPRYLELTKVLPSLQDVQVSYIKLRALCAPVSDRELTEQDEKFLSSLDKTCWLLYVSFCLKTANEAAGYLKAGDSVVLQENDGRDMCCLISSLVQIFLDPFYRTITGLQVLIQKEWVALGHPFSDRMGHVYNKQADKSPVFLLFLDCVWQVLQQFPESFEFSETFLTTIWDMVFLPIFDTFQFNSEYDRLVAVNEVKKKTYTDRLSATGILKYFF